MKTPKSPKKEKKKEVEAEVRRHGYLSIERPNFYFCQAPAPAAEEPAKEEPTPAAEPVKTEEAPVEPVKETETPAPAEAPAAETPKEEVKEEKVCFLSLLHQVNSYCPFSEGG